MSDTLVIDTHTNSMRVVEKDYTIEEYKQQGRWPFDYIAGKGLVRVVNDHANKLGRSVVGLEIGVCKAENIVHFLENCDKIEKIYCMDPYMPYMDWTGPVTQETVNEHKRIALKNLESWMDKIDFTVATSTDSVSRFADEFFDYIFIDGDHSYEATKQDIRNYYSKVKKGGIFAGHDINLPEVARAAIEFCQEIGIKEIRTTETNVWFWEKP